MFTMKEAFKAKGLYTEVSDKIDKDKEEELRIKKEKELKAMHDRDEEIKKRREEDQEYEKFVSYMTKFRERPNSDKFLFHLVCSHTPYGKAHRLFNFKEKQKKSCCFCNVEIISVAEYLEIAPDLMIKSLKMEDLERIEFYQNAFRGRKTGIISEETTAIICEPCFPHFINYIETQILMGDKVINGAIRKMMQKEGYACGSHKVRTMHTETD